MVSPRPQPLGAIGTADAMLITGTSTKYSNTGMPTPIAMPIRMTQQTDSMWLAMPSIKLPISIVRWSR